MKLAVFLQLATMLGDLLLLLALIYCFSRHPALGLICLYFVHCAVADTGGWFFAWRKANRAAFFRN